MTDHATMPEELTCPACHFGCKLANYQCGRGKEFYDIVAAGGELPERRGPMLTPSEQAAFGEGGRPPLNHRVMHALNIMANVLQRRHEEAGVKKMTLGLARAGSFCTLPMLAKRMNMTGDAFDETLAKAKREGFVTVEDDERGFRIARITTAGSQRAAAWQTERDAHTADFLSPLSEEEKEELERLLRKLIPKKPR